MSVKYKLYQNTRKNSSTRGMWYARAAMTDTIRLKQISTRIQRNCTVKASDVMAVLTELVEVMKDELLASHRVVLDGFGSFKVGLKTTPAPSPKTFTGSKNIKSAHVNFLPAIEVDGTGRRVKSLLSGISIKEYDSYEVEKESEGGNG